MIKPESIMIMQNKFSKQLPKIHWMRFFERPSRFFKWHARLMKAIFHKSLDTIGDTFEKPEPENLTTNRSEEKMTSEQLLVAINEVGDEYLIDLASTLGIGTVTESDEKQ